MPNTKNAGHKVAIVGESCNVDAYAKIPALFITMLFVHIHMYCTTVHTDCDRTVVSLTDQSIAPSRGHHTHTTHDTHTLTESNVELGFPE